MEKKSKCLTCGKELSKNRYKFCKKHFQFGKNNPYWKGGKIELSCLFCGKKFKDYLSNKRKYCSRKCHGKWNKKVKRWADENNPIWKGNNVGYDALHTWVSRKLGKPENCKFCGETRKVQWANRDFKYERNLNSWIALCIHCHREYDIKNGKGKSFIKYPERKK